MPRKITSWGAYYVTAPNREIHLFLKEFIAHFPKGSEPNGVEKTKFVQNSLGSSEFSVGDLRVPDLRNSLQGNGQNDKAVLQKLGLTADTVKTISEDDLVEALNAVLPTRDFYSNIVGDYYKRILKDEIRNILNKAQANDTTLADQDYKRLNRALLEAIYPHEIQKSSLLDELFEEPYFIHCTKYFREISPVQKPFKIIYKSSSIKRLGWVGYDLRVVWDEEDMGAIQQALDEEMPFEWEWRQTYLFGHSLWKVTESEVALSQNDLKLLFLEAVDKERKKFERLKNKFSGVAGQKLENKRECIAEEVRIFVWRRDEGKCVKCGSQQNLEFDHIIPVAKGGGKTARNIQILCEKCNREKSTNI